MEKKINKETSITEMQSFLFEKTGIPITKHLFCNPAPKKVSYKNEQYDTVDSLEFLLIEYNCTLYSKNYSLYSTEKLIEIISTPKKVLQAYNCGFRSKLGSTSSFSSISKIPKKYSPDPACKILNEYFEKCKKFLVQKSQKESKALTDTDGSREEYARLVSSVGGEKYKDYILEFDEESEGIDSYLNLYYDDIEKVLLKYNFSLYEKNFKSLSKKQLADLLTLPRAAMRVYEDWYLKNIGSPSITDPLSKNLSKCTNHNEYMDCLLLNEFISSCKEIILKKYLDML